MEDDRFVRSKLDPTLHLTLHRVEIVRLLSLGLSEKQIALKMGLSQNTIAEHIHIMLHTLGAKNSTHLVGLAIQHGFIAPPPGDGTLRRGPTNK